MPFKRFHKLYFVLKYPSKSSFILAQKRKHHPFQMASYRESNLIFTLSSDEEQSNKFAFAFAFVQCRWTLSNHYKFAHYSPRIACLRAIYTERHQHVCNITSDIALINCLQESALSLRENRPYLFSFLSIFCENFVNNWSYMYH